MAEENPAHILSFNIFVSVAHSFWLIKVCFFPFRSLASVLPDLIKALPKLKDYMAS